MVEPLKNVFYSSTFKLVERNNKLVIQRMSKHCKMCLNSIYSEIIVISNYLRKKTS